MALSQKQTAFLEKRRRLLNAWRIAGPLLLATIFCLAVFLKISTPLLIDPYEVISRQESGDIAQSTLEMMVVLLPVMLIMICFILVAVVILMYAAFSNEKKYLEMLNIVERDQSGGK